MNAETTDAAVGKHGLGAYLVAAEPDAGQVEACLRVIEQHDAKVGPITGYWTCACGVQSDNTRASQGGPTPFDRRAEYREHLAAAIAARIARSTR